MNIKYLSLLLLWALPATAQFTNLTFTWDASLNATGYRFYDVTGTRVLVGTSATNRFTYPNWDVRGSRSVMVTATNMVFESDPSPTLVVPPAPASPQNLKPIPLSIVAPVPGVLEISQDLVDWTQRIRLASGPSPTNVLLTWVKYPTEPMLFLRSKTAAPLITPPLP